MSGEPQRTQREVAKGGRDHHGGSMYLCAMGMQQPMPKDFPLTFKPGGACFRLIGTHYWYWKYTGKAFVCQGKLRAGYLENLFHRTRWPLFIRGKNEIRGRWYKVNLLLKSALRNSNLEQKKRHLLKF